MKNICQNPEARSGVEVAWVKVQDIYTCASARGYVCKKGSLGRDLIKTMFYMPGLYIDLQQRS